MVEWKPIRRSDLVALVGVATALAVPGPALLLWAETREYSDNQRNWAYLAGWLAVAGAGLVVFLATASAIRNHGSRRTQVGFAAVVLALSTTVLITLALAD